MGEEVARECGWQPVVVGSIPPDGTTAQDTRDAAQEMRRLGVDLLLFAGGDGTARDIYAAIGLDVPALGIPAGVKIHSGVYATNPRSAGDLAARYLQGQLTRLQEKEVMDIDEEAIRQGRVSAQLFGYLNVPFERRFVQGQKVGSAGENRALASLISEFVYNRLSDDVTYVLGPGSTTKAIAAHLGLEKTLIGVDVLRNRQWVGVDVNEAQLLECVSRGPTKIVITPIGGQGYLFGRGNQQISPRVITAVGADNILVVGTRQKIYALSGRPLLVDTGDPEVDELLSGYVSVITGYDERMVYPVAS
jgi:predicted polyphosphate/ATP-dependent NAD kinase